jgi:hypothetical protein
MSKLPKPLSTQLPTRTRRIESQSGPSQGSGHVSPKGSSNSLAPGDGLSLGVTVGDRVVLSNTGQEGYLRFLGTTSFKEGTWAGVELDLMNGKNNGSVGGVRYFTCEPNRGLFVHAAKVKRKVDAVDGSKEPTTPTSRTPSRSRLAMSSSRLRETSGASPALPSASKSNEHLDRGAAGGLKYQSSIPSMRPSLKDATATPQSTSSDPNDPFVNSQPVDKRVEQLQAHSDVVDAENQLLKLEMSQIKARLEAKDVVERGLMEQISQTMQQEGSLRTCGDDVDKFEAERKAWKEERQSLLESMQSKGEVAAQATEWKNKHDAAMSDKRQLAEEYGNHLSALQQHLQQLSETSSQEASSRLAAEKTVAVLSKSIEKTENDVHSIYASLGLTGSVEKENLLATIQERIRSLLASNMESVSGQTGLKAGKNAS